MIKGARKQMIVVRTGNSRYFDEAYFVLRRDLKEHERESGDFLFEVNKLLSDSTQSCTKKEHPRLWRWLFFGAGSLCGGILAALVFFLIL